MSVVPIVWSTIGTSLPIGTGPTWTLLVVRRSGTRTSAQYLPTSSTVEATTVDARARGAPTVAAGAVNPDATEAQTTIFVHIGMLAVRGGVVVDLRRVRLAPSLRPSMTESPLRRSRCAARRAARGLK